MVTIAKVALPKSAQIWSRISAGDFLDGYAVASPLNAKDTVDTGLTMPNWANWLLGLRNMIVKPFGLKTDMDDAQNGAIFPVQYETTEEIIVGTDDRHLDFRITVLRENDMIHMGTWVRPKNVFGKIYLTVVMPFHILIVRDAMRRIATTGTSQ
jgi:hypothetical protein